MKYLSIPQLAVIQAADGEELQRLFNERMAELADNKPQYTYPQNMGFTVFINYEIRRQIPEDLSDEYFLRGECYECRQCPAYRPPTDGRVKRGNCIYEEYSISPDKPCCNTFYQKLHKGEWVAK